MITIALSLTNRQTPTVNKRDSSTQLVGHCPSSQCLLLHELDLTRQRHCGVQAYIKSHPALQSVRFKHTPGKEWPPTSTVSISVALTEINKTNGVNLFHLQTKPIDYFQRTKCRQLSYWPHFFPSNLKSLIGCHFSK